ncbi:MAG: hypothetical protein DLM52_07815 [Chthoniobacterales bacterium]|nr:MAG: hypothetical protein DLM52_07815 [Chthoniobacterales bacterium]
MSFEEFQNRARLFVIGALDGDETDEFETARRVFGQRAENYLSECYALSEAFALSLKPAKSSEQIKSRLMEMVRERKKS